MHSPDRSCRYSIQDIFFWRLAGPVAPTGKAIVHWIGCVNAIKLFFYSDMYHTFLIPTLISGVNGKLIYSILFCLGRNDEIRKEYLSTGY